MSWLKLFIIMLTTVIFDFSDKADGSYVTLRSETYHTPIFSEAKLLCQIAKEVNSDRVGFLKDGREVSFVRYAFLFCMPTARYPYYTHCGFGTKWEPANKTRQFHLIIKNITVELLLSKWSCEHQREVRSNVIQLLPFDITLKLSSHDMRTFIPVDTPMVLECVIEPAQYLSGTVQMVIHVNPQRKEIFGSANQDGAICIIGSYMMKCGIGTNQILSKRKVYLLRIDRMKPLFFSKWTCNQHMFLKESKYLDLKPYSICKVHCVNGVLYKKNCTCDCSDFWHGPQCDKCTISCKHGKHQDPCSCVCDHKWTGPTCDTEIICNITSCVHGSLDKDNCKCICPDYWSGYLCETCGIECVNGFIDEKNCTCNCSDFWDGPHCDNCTISCKHGKHQDPCSCDCNRRWTGPTCDTESVCNITSCVNGKLDEDNCTCICHEDWSGVLCDNYVGDYLDIFPLVLVFIMLMITFIVVSCTILCVFGRRSHKKSLTEDQQTMTEEEQMQKGYDKGYDNTACVAN